MTVNIDYYSYALKRYNGKLKYLPTYDYLVGFKSSKELLAKLYDANYTIQYSNNDVHAMMVRDNCFIVDGYGVVEHLEFQPNHKFKLKSSLKANRKIDPISDHLTMDDFKVASSILDVRVKNRISVTGKITEIERNTWRFDNKTTYTYTVTVRDFEREINIFVRAPKEVDAIFQTLGTTGMKDADVTFTGNVSKKYKRSIKLNYAEDFIIDPVVIAYLAIQT